MKKIFSKQFLIGAIILVIALLFWWMKPSQFSVEQCSPLPDGIHCIEFTCAFGEPQMTIGGSGSCSDGSQPVIIKTWTE